jgi:glycerate kinase
MKKVVIASDSFKGSLSSSEVAAAAAEGIRDIFPECEIISLNVGDGGEGTVSSLNEAIGGEKVSVKVKGPLGDEVQACYIISTDEDGNHIAMMEMAQASGLTLIGEDRRNPLYTSSYGTGEMMADALAKGCRRLLIGIGGSATNDAGTGMLEALGYRFYDRNGHEITGCCGIRLKDIFRIDRSSVAEGLEESAFTVACDVDNPFTGPNGATFTYGRQKGADDDALNLLEEGMSSFEALVRDMTGLSLNLLPGSGAAGGMGGTLQAFLGAELKKGSGLILDAAGFAEKAENADLIITGEGKIDGQSLRGKLPYGVLSRAGKTPVIAICGISELTPEQADSSGFQKILPVCSHPLTEEDLAEAMNPENAKENIRLAIVDYLQTGH